MSVCLNYIENNILHVCLFMCGFCTLFTRLVNMDFSKFFFKIKFYGTIHTFKNYFATVFSIFNNKRYSNRPDYLQSFRYELSMLELFQSQGNNDLHSSTKKAYY